MALCRQCINTKPVMGDPALMFHPLVDMAWVLHQQNRMAAAGPNMKFMTWMHIISVWVPSHQVS